MLMLIFSRIFAAMWTQANVSEVSEAHAASMIRVEVSTKCQYLCMHRVFALQTDGGESL
jgi:hypothetical protein